MIRMIIIVLFLFTSLLRAQDVHFSQYYFSPLTMNPAYTGKFNGDWRVFGNYRSQWRVIDKAFNTFSAGGDMNFYPRNLQVSGGLIFVNDLSGGDLGVNKILPSAAWHARVGRNVIHMGIQPGLVIKTINFHTNTFPNQLNWQTGYFDNTLPNMETNVSQRFMYADINAGFAVSRRMNKIEPEIGYSAFHINKPRENFLATQRTALPVRQAVNVAVSYSVTNSVVLQAHSLYGFTTRASDWLSGVQAEYVLSRTAFYANSVFGGFMWRDGFNRNPDAAVATIGFNNGPLTVGVSYDFTFSQLRTAVDSRGAFELALIYRGKNTRLYEKTIPCERY